MYCKVGLLVCIAAQVSGEWWVGGWAERVWHASNMVIESARLGLP